MTTTVTEQIKILVELQKIDTEIYQLKKELAEVPVLQKKIETDFEKKKIHLKAAEAEYKTAQVYQKEKEIDLQSREDKIKKLQGQLYALKSNKEYTAMEMEINGAKADKSLLEEEILGLLDSAEGVKSKVAKEKEALAADEKKMKDELDAQKKKSDSLTADIASGDEKRKAYVPNIEPKLLSQYERILKNREGVALVPVKNNSCGGCHLDLPPQTLNEIQQQGKVIVCESCARLLYWPV